MKPIFATLILAALLVVAPSSAPAQDKAVADHPAAKVVAEFLPTALRRDWKTAAKFVDPTSLSKLQRGWIAESKRTRNTIDEEKEVLRSIGKSSFDEVAKMPPAEFYAAYQISLQRRFNLDPERLKKIADTITLEFLSLGEEEGRAVHVLVRTRHQDGKNNISRLELISLVNTTGKWRVSLDEQRPKISPIKK